MSLPTNFFIGRGGGKLVAIDFAASTLPSGMYSATVGGTEYWFANNTATTENVTEIYLTVNEGASFNVAMIGASGAGNRLQGNNGAGGIGIGNIIVPTGVTQLFCAIGGGGLANPNNNGTGYAGNQYGGNGGQSASGYAYSAGGGGWTGIHTGNTYGHSNILCCVGASGGGGGTSSAPSTHGGGFNQNGEDGISDAPSDPDFTAHGGTLSSGGAAAVRSLLGHWYNRGFGGAAYTGGTGGSGQYDAGGGGGAGYYGGAGGHPGGGYSAGSGAAGSGYLNTNHGTVLNANRGNNSSYYLKQYIQQITGDDLSTYTGDTYGSPAGGSANGYAGTMIFWND